MIHYSVFILGLAIVTICIIAAVYLSYGKNGRLRDIVQFVISPKEDLELDLKISSIIKTVVWFFLITLSIKVSYHFVDLIFYSESPEMSFSTAINTLPLLAVLILPPILEETACRLPLKRKRLYVALSSAALMFTISNFIFSTRLYDVTWERLLSSAIVALIAWFWGYKWIAKINFKTLFWILALYFSIRHINNYDLSTIHGGWIRAVLIESTKIPSALIYSYARIKHGFGISVALHFANNLTPLLWKHFEM